MINSKQVFETTSNRSLVARVAIIMTYIGLGSAQFVLVPPLSDPLSMIEEQLLTPTSATILETHNI